MTRRFEQLGLLQSVRFVKAVDGRSRTVDDHLATMNVDPEDPKARAEVACWLSHLRALRTFLRETPATTAAAIVFEDDVLLHREWHERLAAVLDNLPGDAPVCALGYNDEDWHRPPETWEGFAWAGVDPDRRVLIDSLRRQWGAHAYWISRSHARDVLGERLPQVPEFIQKVPGAFAAFPSLAIQDGSPSTIASEPARIRSHRMAHASWGVENYLTGDDEHMLAKRSENAPTVCLCALVWNDGELIDRLASSVEGLVDRWVICDTGSTDGTPERVAKAFAGIPGRLYEDTWQDDATNRSLLLERARGAADYLLVVDASHSISLRAQLDRLGADAYRPRGVESRTGWAPVLVRGDLPWRAVGAINAEIECDRPYRSDQLNEMVIGRNESDAHRRADLARKLVFAEDLFADRPADRSLSFSIAELTRDLTDPSRSISSLRNVGGLALFAMTQAGVLQHARQLPGRGWSEWWNVGPLIRSAPAAAQNADGRLEVFAVGPGGSLGHLWESEPGQLSDWEDLGHLVGGAPCICLDHGGHLQVFAADLGGRLGRIHQLEPGHSAWSDWESYGCPVRGRPAACLNLDGRLEVFARGPDGRLGHVWEWDPGGSVGWSDWGDFHQLLGGDPAVCQNADGRLEVFAAGPDGRLGHVWQLQPGGSAGWSEWSEFGHLIRAAPAVARNPHERLELFAGGVTGTLGHVWQHDEPGDFGWSDWSDFAVPIRDTPSVVRNTHGRLEVFAVGLDGRIGHVWQHEPEAEHAWSEWSDLGAAGWGGLAVCRTA
jgi:hypothetical protein